VPASYKATSAPARASSHAQASPTTPAPTTATFIARTPYARGTDFSQEDRERAARYHRPLYWAALARLLLVIAVYAASTAVDSEPLGWAGAAALWATFVTITASVVCLPLDLWRGYVRERRWGFSTQSLGGWLLDRAKGLAIGIAIGALAWTALIALTHAFPGSWPLAASALAAAAVLLLSFVAPVVLEPMFNRFRPLPNERLARELRTLAERAGVPVRDVLVADASRRTRKTNAYVSGIGATRRVVVWDTLLESASKPELKLVVAHELGHRRARHVLKGTALAMAGAIFAVVVIWAVLGTPRPHDYPRAALLLLGLELAGMPIGAWISRRWERAADRFSLDLTGDRDAFVRAHVALARSNLSDLDPPRLVYLLLFTHPTPPERLAIVT
jgi:STE24 endopeptidase